MINRLRTWWQVQTGEEDTPLDGDTPAFVISLLFNLCLLVVMALISIAPYEPDSILSMKSDEEEEEIELEELMEVPEEVYHSPQEVEAIGANSFDGVEMAFSEAPVISDISEVVSPEVEIDHEIGEIEINETIAISTGLNYNENLSVKGAAGVGETGAKGAVDRITHEIMQSLEERKTLVVWLFDQSGSLNRQRSEINERFDRIYEELGVLEAAGNDAFAKHDDKPLLTSVVAFGENVTLRTPEPTDNLADIKAAVTDIEMDESGVEKTFSAVYMAADRFKGYREADPQTGEPKRNVMIVVFTDEVGDDYDGLEHTVKICRKHAMPVYVVGVPAPFGRRYAQVKWVDPNPEYDQSPQWGEVMQGPESLMPERLQLHFSGAREDTAPIDSGFGPFALTRLVAETGGIYFAVHPNRRVGREVNRGETEAMSAHFKHFFDPSVMSRYQPLYVSIDEYKRQLMKNKSRAALVQASQMSWVSQMSQPETRFVKRDEGTFVQNLEKAQQNAARLEPKVNAIYETLKLGEVDRSKESVPRWQAGYDLAMGRALAVKARTEAYNALLAKAKRSYKFEGKNNTLELKATNEFGELSSALGKTAEKARMYLTRVVEDHPDTPWAMLAQRELDTPLAWEWKESHTDVTPRQPGMGGNGNAVGRDDKLKMLKKGPPKRKLPKL